jgi:transmembrane sensor
MEQDSDARMDALLSEQAAAWFVRLIANDLSLHERREYLAWLKASARHVEALLDIYRYHGYGRKAKLNSKLVSPDTDPGANVIPFALRSGVVPIGQNRQLQRPGSRTMKVAAAIAGIAFMIAIGFVVKGVYLDQRIATGPGQWDKRLLADGTVLRVGPNTHVRWSLGEEQRTVVLSRGEALFEVMKDPRRPFIVTTQIGDVRAVGTEFGVSLMSGSVVVTVAHGKVAVSKPGNGSPGGGDVNGSVADLVANQQLVMSLHKVEPVQQVDAGHELQWATGYYEFRGETVREAADEFNRRNRKQVVVENAAVGAISMPFATVQLNDPDSFAAMLAARADVQVSYDDSDLIRLQSE